MELTNSEIEKLKEQIHYWEHLGWLSENEATLKELQLAVYEKSLAYFEALNKLFEFYQNALRLSTKKN